MPTAASVAGGFAFAVIIMGLHLLVLSGDPSLVVSPLTGRGSRPDDQVIKSYQSVVQNPLDKVFGNDKVGVLSTMLVWGAIGWAVYALIDFAMTTSRDFRRDAEEVTVPDFNEVIRHPLHNQLVIRLLWRFFMGLVLIVMTAAFRPLFSHLLQQDVQLLQSESILHMLKALTIIIVGWIALIHLYVILFRLFVLRTRVFGEIIY